MKTKDAPAFDFYPERWLVGTASMTDAEQLAYLRLLCHQWVMEGLPADEGALKRLAGKGVTGAVLAKMPVCDDGKRRNSRLEIVRENQRARIEKSKAKIKRMNEARAEKNKEKSHSQETLQDDLQEALQGPPHQSPFTNHPSSLGISKPAPDSCTLEEAKKFVTDNAVGMTPQGVELWHATQEKNGWTTGRANGSIQQVTNWRAALRSSCAWVREALAKAEAAERRGAPGSYQNPAPKVKCAVHNKWSQPT